MSDIQKLAAHEVQVLTGAVQFGDDTPGVFVRGDTAAYYSELLRKVIKNGSFDPMTIGMLRGLRDLLGRGEAMPDDTMEQGKRALLDAAAPSPLASEVADAGRVIAWARSNPRRPANSAFTAGAERQAAYWIEWAEQNARRALPAAFDGWTPESVEKLCVSLDSIGAVGGNKAAIVAASKLRKLLEGVEVQHAG